MSVPAADPAAWSVIVPVKRPELAKTRLSGIAGPQRAALARAFAADTVAAALEAREVAEVLVVTDDGPAAHELTTLGAVVVADAPEAGLNAALRHGAETAVRRRPGVPCAALSADLPALRPAELDIALRAARAHRLAFVCDAVGIGTTLYCVTSGPFDPRFGGRSRAAHRRAGAVELDLAGIVSLRRDVDTEVDLWDAVRLGVGERTAVVVASLDAVQGA